MGAIIQTLTLAAILLIIGLVCTTLGIAGLVWRARRDRERERHLQSSMTYAAGPRGDRQA
jgi:hypothetical protein